MTNNPKIQLGAAVIIFASGAYITVVSLLTDHDVLGMSLGPFISILAVADFILILRRLGRNRSSKAR